MKLEALIEHNRAALGSAGIELGELKINDKELRTGYQLKSKKKNKRDPRRPELLNKATIARGREVRHDDKKTGSKRDDVKQHVTGNLTRSYTVCLANHAKNI